MRTLGILALLAISPLAVAQNPGKCTSNRVRRSAHSLSPSDWERIGHVLSQMHDAGHVDRFARAHQALFESVHGSTTFFPFHRRFVQEFEDIGRQIDPGFTVPYWDSTRDYEDPASSPILSSGTLGGNGQGPDMCLPDGIQGGWTMGFPGRHCLRRDYRDGDTMEPWVPAELISSYIQSDDQIADFREHIEYGIHGAVHLGLGGDAATRFAPNDFFFFMHHANIDRLWWLWQNSNHDPLDYNGPGTNGEASLSDVIPQNNDVSFDGARVDSVMVLGYGPACYTYDSAPNAPSKYPGSSDGPDRPNRIIHHQPAVFSGSSNSAGFGLEVARIHRALDQDPALKEYFPGVAALGSSRVAGGYDSRPVDKCQQEATAYPARRLVHPAPMTDEWIRMHGFDPARVERLYNDGCMLIDRLNNSTYVSPYL
ncbi:hypothetical protein GGF46_000935 [Coemansia sp. RSA 552]|nr:hypothetical protein GGF46_000935 [Coemansia sp. RSA 552]